MISQYHRGLKSQSTESQWFEP